MTELIQSGGLSGSALIPLVLDVAAKATVVLLLAGAVAGILRRASAAVRHHVWLLAVMGLIVLPALAPVLPSLRVEVLPDPRSVADAPDEAHFDRVASPGRRAGSPAAQTGGQATDTPRAALPDVSFVAAPAGRISEESRSSADLMTLASAAIWLTGALLCMLPYGFAMARVRRVVRGAARAPVALRDEARKCCERLGLSDPPRLLVSSRVDVPMACGLARPAILLPAEFPRWTPSRREAVLLHELAHVRRRDCLTRLLARVGVALHWFHPLAWFAEARLRTESERACDDVVLSAGAPAEEYADCLVAIARSLTAHGRPPAAATPMARSTRLEGRVMAILDHRRPHVPLGHRVRYATLVLAMLGLLPLAALHLTAKETGGQGKPSSDAIITVAVDGSGAYASIQSAVDAAPDGAVIRIGSGHYDERVVVRKTLTLEGAGWSDTVLTARHDLRNLTEDRAFVEAIERRIRAAATDAERRAIRAEIIKQQGKHAFTLTVEGVQGVVLRDLKIVLRGKGDPGRIGLGAAVNLTGCGAQLSRCVVAGSPANGIQISGGSDVEVRECLVAGVWGTGIAVDQRGASGAVRIVDSELRNCRYAGIRFRPGGATNRVERCRISGSAWHGIRYDHCAPAITGNLIFDNERCGIYASGRTAATVEKNLFYRNGITCWFQNRDTIRGNTFVAMHGDTYAGDSQGVCILGAAKPRIVKNIFADLETGVYLGNTSDSKSDGKVDLEGNLFWELGRQLAWSRPDDEGTEPEVLAVDPKRGNRVSDPGFVDADARDFSLPPDSALRRDGIGAADHPSFESPWPLQPEETMVTAEKVEENTRRAAESARFQAQSLAKPWIEDAMQIRDRATRDAAVDRIRAALASEDPVEKLAGLTAFRATLEVNYDKAPFREWILPLVHSNDEATQVSAFYALYATGAQPGDIELLYEALENEPSRSLRRSASQLLRAYTGGAITDRAADVVLDLLHSDRRDEIRETLRGLWGARVSPAVETRLIELAARGSESRGDAIYFGLSTLQNKSKPVLEALFEATEDPDHNNSGRALWGLGHGVPVENQTMVADFVVQLIEVRGPSVLGECIGLLERYGNESHLGVLEKLAANDLLAERLREKARSAAEFVGARVKAKRTRQ